MEKNNDGIWTDEFTISHFFVNPKGFLSIHGLSYFLQEGAIGHADYRSFGYEDMIRKNQAWVMTRLGIKVNKQPSLADKIILETWVHLTTDSFSVRDFHIMDPNGDILVEARTSWMIMDLATRKPIRINKEGIERLPHHFNRLQSPIELIKIPEIPETENGHNFQVVVSDLDMNQHVNHISFVRWFMDRFDWEFHMKHQLSFFTINYMAEVLYGDKLSIILNQDNKDPDTFLLKIIRLSDHREIARCLTTWDNH